MLSCIFNRPLYWLISDKAVMQKNFQNWCVRYFIPILGGKTMDLSTFSCCVFQDTTWYASSRHVFVFQYSNYLEMKWFLLYKENNQAFVSVVYLAFAVFCFTRVKFNLEMQGSTQYLKFLCIPFLRTAGKVLFHAIVYFLPITWHLRERKLIDGRD